MANKIVVPHFAIGYRGGLTPCLIYRHIDRTGWLTDKVICDLWDGDMMIAARKALCRQTLWERIKTRFGKGSRYDF